MSRYRHSRGIALITVLWVLVLLSLIAAGFSRTTRTDVGLARNRVENAKAEALAEAGVNLAVLKLLSGVPAERWRADGSVYGWRFGGGEILIEVRDEGGKIDLNAAPPELLAALFAAAGLTPDEATALADAVADYRDTDDFRRTSGAEDDDYESAELGYGAKDAPFELIEELQQVIGMPGDLYSEVAEAITVYTRRPRPQEALAPPLVVAALAGTQDLEADPEALSEAGVPEQDVLAGDDAAESDEGVEVDEAAEDAEDAETDPLPVLVSQASEVPLSSSGVVALHVEALSDGGGVFVRDTVVRLLPGRERPYQVLAWRQGQRRLQCQKPCRCA